MSIDPEATPVKKKAVLVAVTARFGTEEPHPRARLDGAAWNAEATWQLLSARGFETRILSGRDATREAILGATAWLVAGAAEEEHVLVLAVSAHGELHGGRRRFFPCEIGAEISDEDLEPHFRAVGASSRLYCVYDCCQTRVANGDVAPTTPPDGRWAELRGCDQGETALYPGMEYGMFTRCLLRAAENGGSTAEAVRLAGEEMRLWGQHPTVAGPGDLLGREIFT